MTLLFKFGGHWRCILLLKHVLKSHNIKPCFRTPKKNLSMNEYLLKIHGFVDLLAFVGVNLSVKDHIDVITDGLPSEYNTFFLTINSRIEDYSVEEIESLLLAQGARIEKHNRNLDSKTASINVAQVLGNFGKDNFSHGKAFTSNN